MTRRLRWIWFGVSWTAAWIAVAVWLVHEMRWWSTTLQLIGAVVTAYGLSRAYVRSAHDETVGEFIRRTVARWWVKLSRRRRDVVITPISGTSSATMGTPTVRITATGLTVSENAPLQVQIAEIVVHVNRLTEDRLPAMEDRIDEVKRDVARMTNDLSALDQQTRDHIERRLDEIDKRLDAKQVLDLRWAIVGLVITTVGVAFGYW